LRLGGPCREAHSPTVHARRAACSSARRTELADIPAKPHGLGLRFLADLRYPVPSHLRVLHRRRERQARRARRGDARSNAGVDSAAASQRDAVRAGSSVHHPRSRRQVRCSLRPRRQGRRCACPAYRGAGAAHELGVRTTLFPFREQATLRHVRVFNRSTVRAFADGHADARQPLSSHGSTRSRVSAGAAPRASRRATRRQASSRATASSST
jgi:hypothetical protein